MDLLKVSNKKEFTVQIFKFKGLKLIYDLCVMKMQVQGENLKRDFYYNFAMAMSATEDNKIFLGSIESWLCNIVPGDNLG